MPPTLPLHDTPAGGLLSPLDLANLESCALSLRRSHDAHAIQPLLRGKNLALLSEQDDTDDAAMFRSAAVELGAHVAHIRPSLSDLGSPREIRRMAQVLGRLYDAVECEGLPRSVVEQLRCDAGVPVFQGLATREHPIAALGDTLAGEASQAEHRRYLLQAALITAVA